MHKPSTANLRCKQPDEIRCFLFGGYCHQCSGFDEESFLNNWHPSIFLAYAFIGRQVKSLYRRFEGDLVMALVMCEIWQYNLGRYFDRAGPLDATATLQDPERRQAVLPPCNAYSISQVLGVPSETVRRKVKKLVELGWVERSNDGELIATLQCEQHFSPEATLEFMREFVSIARHVLAMIEKTDSKARGGGQ